MLRIKDIRSLVGTRERTLEHVKSLSSLYKDIQKRLMTRAFHKLDPTGVGAAPLARLMALERYEEPMRGDRIGATQDWWALSRRYGGSRHTASKWARHMEAFRDEAKAALASRPHPASDSPRDLLLFRLQMGLQTLEEQFEKTQEHAEEARHAHRASVFVRGSALESFIIELRKLVALLESST